MKRQKHRESSVECFHAPAYSDAEFRKTLTALIEQQMWCWGCDVRRKEGNLLVAYGLEKAPSPDPRFHSAYRCALDSGRLTLWGWGFWFAMPDYGSIFISRSNFRVCYTPDVILSPAAWSEPQLPRLSAPRDENARLKSCFLLSRLFSWISGYERWLTTQLQPDYREYTLTAWPQRRRYRGGIPPAQVAHQWSQFAQMAVHIKLT